MGAGGTTPRYYSVFLKSSNCLSFLSKSEIERIDAVCTPGSRRVGEVVLVGGATRDRFFIIYEGEEKIRVDYGNSDQILLALFGPGRIFGELVRIDNLSRSATVVTKIPAIVS